MVSIEALAASLRSIAVPGMTPKALRRAVRERHPEASKKAVARAAFYALITAQSEGGEAVTELHGFALAERTPDDEPPVTIGGRPRKKRHAGARKAEGPGDGSAAAKGADAAV